jgi:hypothetical protein
MRYPGSRCPGNFVSFHQNSFLLQLLEKLLRCGLTLEGTNVSSAYKQHGNKFTGKIMKVQVDVM